MNKKKRGRRPLPEGFSRVYFNASSEDAAYFREVRQAQTLATRSDVLRLIVSDARVNARFLDSNDANIATEQPL